MTLSAVEEDTLAAAIIRLRKDVGSQAKLAAKTGVSERTVKRWERGAVPQRPAREALVRLGIQPTLFASADLRDEIETRLRTVEAEVARIRELLG